MDPQSVKTSTPASTGAKSGASVLVPRVLEDMATCFRAGGLVTVLLRRDCSLAWADPGAPAFLRAAALPLLEPGQALAQNLHDKIAQFSASSGVTQFSVAPGLMIALFPCIEKRQVTGAILLVGLGETFKVRPEDTAGLCQRLGADAASVEQQASATPRISEESLVRHARILLGMTRDQMRITGLQSELDSLSTQLSNSYEELSLIYQVSSGMKVNRGASDFFRQACLDVLDVMNMRAMGVALWGENSCLKEPALYGDLSLTPQQLKQLTDTLMNILRQRKSPLLINDLKADKTLIFASEYAGQLIAVPLQRQDQVLGCLFGIDKPMGEFDSVDSKLLNSIANESAIYLENSMLFEDVRDLMMGMLHSLTSAVDAKDAYTCGHSERVALLSKRLALEAGMAPALVERIYMAGLLHDVGKIGVPESVLQKAGRLTDEEFEQIKKHPQIGGRILADIKQVQDIIPGVLYHHERYDGHGYPSGLSGQNIPLMGRIICLADCFDAMTSSRTYRRALPLEVALIEIRRCSGAQFDPALAEAFLRIGAEEFRALLSEHHRQRSQVLGVPSIVAA